MEPVEEALLLWIVVRTILFQCLEHQLQIRPSKNDSPSAESLCFSEKDFPQ